MSSFQLPSVPYSYSSRFSPGKELNILRKKYIVSRILHEPRNAFTVHFETTRDNVVISSRDASVEQVSCLAKKAGEPYDYFLEIYYWTDSGIISSSLKEKRRKLPGAIEEPDGSAVLTLEKIASSKDFPMGSENLIYIWQVEKSLDPKGMLAGKQKFSDYLRKYLTPGCVITLAGGHKYRVESFLNAEGGFGTIFKATMLEKNRLVVLKFQETTSGVNEALALREFYGHPNIVEFLQSSDVVDYNYSNGLPALRNPLAGDITIAQQQGEEHVHFYCIVAEFVAGKNIDNLIKDEPKTKFYDLVDRLQIWGKLDKNLIGLNDCVNYIEQLAEAVDHIHHRGYIHLDIKPQNIMVDENDRLKIVDMGSLSKIGNIFAWGAGNHAAPEVKEFTVNKNQSMPMWVQNFVTTIHTAWQPDSNKPGVLSDLNNLHITDGYKKFLLLCQHESAVARDRISTQSDVFSIGAVFLSLLSRRHPRQVAQAAENMPTKVGKIMFYEGQIPFRRMVFMPAVRKAMSINISERFQTCNGFKQSIQFEYTKLIYNEIFTGGILFFAMLSGMLSYLLGVSAWLSWGIFGVSLTVLTGWRATHFKQKPLLSAIQLRPYSIAGARLFISVLILGVTFILVGLGKFLYTEKAFFVRGIDQQTIHTAEPHYVDVIPSESISVDGMVLESGYDAYQAGNYEEAKAQFQTFLRMHRYDFELSDAQIDGFNTETLQQLTKFIIKEPDSDTSIGAILIMAFIEPDRIHQATHTIDLYHLPGDQPPPAISVPEGDRVVKLELINYWYRIWYKDSIYFAPEEGVK